MKLGFDCYSKSISHILPGRKQNCRVLKYLKSLLFIKFAFFLKSQLSGWAGGEFSININKKTLPDGKT